MDNFPLIDLKEFEFVLAYKTMQYVLNKYLHHNFTIKEFFETIDGIQSDLTFTPPMLFPEMNPTNRSVWDALIKEKIIVPTGEFEVKITFRGLWFVYIVGELFPSIESYKYKEIPFRYV